MTVASEDECLEYEANNYGVIVLIAWGRQNRYEYDIMSFTPFEVDDCRG
jgi:hypothetical protein